MKGRKRRKAPGGTLTVMGVGYSQSTNKRRRDFSPKGASRTGRRLLQAFGHVWEQYTVMVTRNEGRIPSHCQMVLHVSFCVTFGMVKLVHPHPLPPTNVSIVCVYTVLKNRIINNSLRTLIFQESEYTIT